MKKNARNIMAIACALALLGFMTGSLMAQTTNTWTQTAGNAQNWEVNGNWSAGAWPSPTSGDTLDFSTVNIAANTTLTLQADRTAEIWKFGDTSGGQTWTVNSGNKMIMAGTTPTINAAVATTLNNVLDGTAGLTKEGAGTLTLSGANTYSGNTTINGGTLYVGNNTAGTLGSGSYAGGITIVSGATLANWSTAAQTLSGTISGAGNISKAYGGTLTLSGANTYSGKTSIAPQTTAGSMVIVSSFNSVNGGTPLLASSSLGCPTTVPNGTIVLGDGGKQASCTLKYIGSGETTDRVMDVRFNGSCTQTIDASGGGLLKFTSPFTVTLSSGYNAFILRGTGSGEIAGNVPQLPAAGLSKQDSGTWTLSGVNTYTGPTAVTAGKLVGVVSGSSSNSAVTVSGGTLSIAVTNNALRWTCKSLTHSAASTLEFAFDAITPSTSVAPLQVNGNVVFAVAPAVSCTGTSLPAGTYPLMTWTGSFNGVAPSALITLSVGTGLLVLDNANKTLWVNVSDSVSSKQPLTWKGPAGSTWVANATVYTNWQDAALVNTNYQETTLSGITVGDNVVFGATGAGTVTLNTIVSPSSVAVNSTANYTFSGSGSIAGPGALTKANSGSLTLFTTNSYSGGTSLGAGTLSIGINDALGTGSVVLGGGTIQSSDATARTLNNPVVLSGNTTVGGTGNLNFTSPGVGSVAVASTLTVNGSLNATFATAFGGSGALTKAGTGTMTLTGTNTYSGATTVSAGTLVIANGGKVFSGGSAHLIGAANSRAQVLGGSGGTSLWDLGNQELYFGAINNSGGDNNSLIIDGTGMVGGAAVTNVSNVWLGRCAGNSSILLTNGAQMSIRGAAYLGSTYYGSTRINNAITIVGGAADSTFYGSSNIFCVGYGERPDARYNQVVVGAGGVMTNVGYNASNREFDFVVGYSFTGTGSGSAWSNQLVVNDGGKVFTLGNLAVGYGTGGGSFTRSNAMLIANGGLVVAPGALYLGVSASGDLGGFNGLLITSSGQLVTGADSIIGYAKAAGQNNINNMAMISGTNSCWNLGGKKLTVGSAVTGGLATGNVLRATAGGMATNINALIVSVNNTLSLGAGGQIYAGAVTNSGTMAVGLDKTATPSCGRLNVIGNLNVSNARLDVSISGTPTEPCVIASYGSLTGSFATTNGLSDKFKLEMNYKGQNQVAIVYSAAGTIIQLR